MSNHLDPLTVNARTVEPPPFALVADGSDERTAWWQSFLEQDTVDVSVCIANWNCSALLHQCLESLHDRPQGVQLETIVVDNASTDGAADMVARDFPEVRLIRNTVNTGFSHANNQAAAVARGRYLFFLNNDTVVQPHTLSRLRDFAQANPNVGMIGPMLRDGQGHMQVSYRMQPTLATFLHRTRLLRWTGLLRRGYRRYRRQQFDLRSPQSVEVLMGAAMFVSRDVFFTCGQWDEDFRFGGEDLDLCYRINRQFSIVFHPHIEITHYGRVSTRQHIGFAETQIAVGFVRYLRKTQCSRIALLVYKAIITIDAPLHWLTKGMQYLWRRMWGRNDKAEKSLTALRGSGQFLRRGLIEFWKA